MGAGAPDPVFPLPTAGAVTYSGTNPVGMFHRGEGASITRPSFSLPRLGRTVPSRLAAVDLGSNSFHLLLARPGDSGFQVVDRQREMVRLAAGLGPDGRLSAGAVARALACLERFGQLIRGLPPGAVRAVGTNTLRSARNAGEFLRAAEARLGHPIEIVSGVEEARLIYLGVAHSVADDGRRRLVVDIGGGSTELIVGEGFTPRELESLYMGCVSYSHRFFAGGRISRKRLRQAVLAARTELEPHERRFRAAGWQRVVGASGTIRAVARVAGGQAGLVTRQALERLMEALVEAGSVERLRLPGLGAERRPVFPGGVAILAAVFDALGVEAMTAAEGALREGLLYDLLGRIHHEDVRGATVSGLERRFAIDTVHARRVADTARALHTQVAAAWDLEEPELAVLLEWAARLHELGLYVAHGQYHKHGAYILGHADLPGFSRQEQAALALLVRAHRRKFPVSEFGAWAPLEAGRLRRLACLLRLAVLLHRGRGEECPAVELAVDGAAMRLVFPPGWLGDHPLTAADLEQEAAWLAAAGVTLDWE